MSEEFVAAFIDNQPQDIQSMFREADNKRYNEMNACNRAVYPAVGGSGAGVTAHPMPADFKVLDDPAFVNKGMEKDGAKNESVERRDELMNEEAEDDAMEA